MALLNIHTFPDPILRKKAFPVTNFDQSLNNTAQSMLETMYVSSGIGLAAIQSGIHGWVACCGAPRRHGLDDGDNTPGPELTKNATDAEFELRITIWTSS